MTTGGPLHVVVIDDVCRFALYVWRYLARSTGFGTGDVPDHGLADVFKQGQRPEPLMTPSRNAEVWWLDTQSGSFEENLRLLAGDLKGDRCFLVDVRAPYRPARGSLGAPSYTLDKVLDILGSHQIRASNSDQSEVFLVSSYYTAPWRLDSGGRSQYLRIHPKSPETLEKLWRKCPSGNQHTAAHAHVLVTGAGFELQDPHALHLGTRSTSGILRAILQEQFKCEIRGENFSYPDKEPNEALRTAAEARDLDLYWDELLRIELSAALATPGPDGRPDKISAGRREYALREAFRQQFVRDDWGFPEQALDALEIPGVTCWLTTNYTRFADRAIELWSAYSDEGTANARWRIVATANEANRLLQELFQDSRDEGSRQTSDRFLFKLHGDLAHLLTMAIAGHDKEIFSPLSLPIASLHPIYAAAEQLLKARLLDDRAATVFWHLVGHGLKDRLLVRLLREVCKATGIERHLFLVVGPEAGAERNLEWASGEALGRQTVFSVRLRAREYMARLRRLGPPNRTDTGSLSSWIREVGSEPEAVSATTPPPARAGGRAPRRRPSARRAPR